LEPGFVFRYDKGSQKLLPKREHDMTDEELQKHVVKARKDHECPYAYARKQKVPRKRYACLLLLGR